MQWPERQTPIGEKVIEGFGRALRKAITEAGTGSTAGTATGFPTCFHGETLEPWMRWCLVM